MSMNIEHGGSDKNIEVSIWEVVFFVGGDYGYRRVGMGIVRSRSIQKIKEMFDV